MREKATRLSELWHCVTFGSDGQPSVSPQTDVISLGREGGKWTIKSQLKMLICQGRTPHIFKLQSSLQISLISETSPNRWHRLSQKPFNQSVPSSGHSNISATGIGYKIFSVLIWGFFERRPICDESEQHGAQPWLTEAAKWQLACKLWQICREHSSHLGSIPNTAVFSRLPSLPQSGLISRGRVSPPRTSIQFVLDRLVGELYPRRGTIYFSKQSLLLQPVCFQGLLLTSHTRCHTSLTVDMTL